MPPSAVITVAVALFIAVSPLHAQEPTTQPEPQPAQGPKPGRGTWAAEGGFGSGVSVLKFRNAGSAWITSFSATYRRSDYESPGDPFLAPQDRTIFSGQMLLGLRSYSRAGQHIRPFSTIAGVVTVNSSGGPARVGLGVAGETGGAYFFSPHVSLGAGVRLGITRESRRDEFGDVGVSSTHVTAQLQTLFLGAVYF